MSHRQEYPAKERYHLFPFQSVPKGADIILYGCGTMGKQYAGQLEKSGFCRVKYFVDRNWKDLGDMPYPVKAPEEILKEKDPVVVIATDRYAEEIREWLVAGGIPDASIVSGNMELNAYSTEKITVSEDARQYLNEARKLLSVMDADHFSDFVRVGKKNDGGYLMLDDFAKGRIAYSFGICNDVSWDKDMADRGYQIYMYDHTIDGLPEQNERFHWSKTGVASEKNCPSELKSLEELIRENGHEAQRNMVLKMDVEGAEWGCIEMTDPSVLDRFDQIVMELHGMIQFGKKEKILRALKKLNETHQCIHIHPNNYSMWVIADDVIYINCYEVTFVNRNRYTFSKCMHTLPHEKDAPCDPLAPELVLGNDYLA